MMAYDRYETRRDRDWRGNSDYERGRRDERGFFERAGDEIASWFGDDDAERRRRQDEQMNRGSGRESGWGRDRDYDRGFGRDYDRDRQSVASSDRETTSSMTPPHCCGGRTSWGFRTGSQRGWRDRA